MIKVREWHNAKCLKCGNVEKEMIAVGPMVFCTKCTVQEFSIGIAQQQPEVDPKCQSYQKWLKSYSGQNF
jgi:hypothetical protein